MHARSHILIQQASIEYKIEHGFILTFVHTYMSVHVCTDASKLHGYYFSADMKCYSIATNFMYTNINTEKRLSHIMKVTSPHTTNYEGSTFLGLVLFLLL